MRKGTGVFKKVEETINVCDFCSTQIIGDGVVLDFKWSDGWDHYGDRIEVCSLDCLIKEIEIREIEFVFHERDSISLYASCNDMQKLLYPKSDTEAK